MKSAVMAGHLRDEVAEIPNQAHAQNVEEDIFTLNAIAPDLLEHLPTLFEETVRESLGYMLGMEESRGVLARFRDDELASREVAFAKLLSVYGPARASPLQKMIDRTFGIRVHNLLQQLA